MPLCAVSSVQGMECAVLCCFQCAGVLCGCDLCSFMPYSLCCKWYVSFLLQVFGGSVCCCILCLVFWVWCLVCACFPKVPDLSRLSQILIQISQSCRSEHWSVNPLPSIAYMHSGAAQQEKTTDGGKSISISHP